MTERREARELALQCLHQWDQQPDQGRELSETLILERASDEDVAAYARRILVQFWTHRDEVDGVIEGVADNWRLARMAVVDRSVLRMAVAEMRYIPSVPPKVSVDEAIELAKRYSTEKSGAFVNGILDRILHQEESNDGA